MSAKRYELDEAQWAKISPLLPGKVGDLGTVRCGQPLVRKRLFVGATVGRALVRPAGAVRQVEDRAPALQPLVPCRRLGAGVRRADRRSRQPVSDDR